MDNNTIKPNPSPLSPLPFMGDLQQVMKKKKKEKDKSDEVVVVAGDGGVEKTPVVVQEEIVKAKAIDVLSLDPQTPIKKLQQLRIEQHPSQGPFSGISTFFRRMFSLLSPAEKARKKEISSLIDNVENQLYLVRKLSSRASRKNRIFSHKYPNEVSTKENSETLKGIREILPELKNQLSKITVEVKMDALEIAENHCSVGPSLVKRIQNLEVQVRNVESRIKILEKLVEVEKALNELPAASVDRKKMKKFRLTQENWDRFLIVKQKLVDMSATLVEACGQNVDLKDEKKVQKIINKKELTPADVSELIASNFPGLSNYYERVFNQVVNLESKKTKELEQQVHALKKINSNYQSAYKHINSLYFVVYSKKFAARFRRAFTNVEKSKANIVKLKARQIKNFSEMESNKVFYDNELAWLQEAGKLDHKRRKLFHTIENTSKKIIADISNKHQMSLKVNDILDRQLDFYFREITLLNLAPDLGNRYDFPWLENQIAQNMLDILNQDGTAASMAGIDHIQSYILSHFPGLKQQWSHILNVIQSSFSWKNGIKLNANLEEAVKKLKANPAPKPDPLPINPPAAGGMAPPVNPPAAPGGAAASDQGPKKIEEVSAGDGQKISGDASKKVDIPPAISPVSPVDASKPAVDNSKPADSAPKAPPAGIPAAPKAPVPVAPPPPAPAAAPPAPPAPAQPAASAAAVSASVNPPKPAGKPHILAKMLTKKNLKKVQVGAAPAQPPAMGGGVQLFGMNVDLGDKFKSLAEQHKSDSDDSDDEDWN